jgi:hypothetical protein
VLPGHLLLALTLLAEGGISVEVSEGCPGRGQIVPALEARLPGVTGSGATRRLELEREGGGLLLRLREPDGAVALERRLEARAASTEGCEALAEAVALVVVRYLREIGYQPPAAAPPEPVVETSVPPPPPPPRSASGGFVGVAGSVRAGSPGAARAELLLGFQLHLQWVAGELAAGAGAETVVAIPDAGPGAELRLRSFPVRLAVGLPLRLTRAQVLVPMAGLSLDVLSFRAAGLTDARRGVRLEPAAEAGASYLLMGPRLFGRIEVAGGLTLGARDFDAGVGPPVFRTPSAYLRAQIEVGLVLWKNERRP